MGKVLDHWIHYTFSSCRRDTISYIRYSLVFFSFSFIFLKAWLIWGSRGALKNPDQHAFHHCHLISHSDDAVSQSFSLQQHCDRTKTLMENYSCCCGAVELLSLRGWCYWIYFAQFKAWAEKSNLRKNYAHTTLLSVSVRTSAKRQDQEVSWMRSRTIINTKQINKILRASNANFSCTTNRKRYPHTFT